MIVHTAALVAFINFAASGVDAHGYLLLPEICPSRPGQYAGNYPSIIDPKVMPPLPGDKYTHFPDSRPAALAFERAFKAAGYKTLKEFIMKHQDMSRGFKVDMPKTPECGFTNPNCKAQPLPDVLQWNNRFIHDGACQPQCGEVVAAPIEFNCREKYPDGKIPYDKKKCKNQETLVFYWVAIQMPYWQVYIDCVKIAGGGGPGNSLPSPGNSTDPNDDYAPPPNNGPPNNGPPNNGPPNNGPPKFGPPKFGPPNNGPPMYGPPKNGPPNPPFGPPNNGPPSNPPYGAPNKAPPSNGPKKPSWGAADQGEVGGEASSPMCKRKMRR